MPAQAVRTGHGSAWIAPFEGGWDARRRHGDTLAIAGDAAGAWEWAPIPRHTVAQPQHTARRSL